MLTFVVGASWPGVAAAAVVFDAGPPAATNQTTATFSFHSTPSGGSLRQRGHHGHIRTRVPQLDSRPDAPDHSGHRRAAVVEQFDDVDFRVQLAGFHGRLSLLAERRRAAGVRVARRLFRPG